LFRSVKIKSGAVCPQRYFEQHQLIIAAYNTEVDAKKIEPKENSAIPKHLAKKS
jgi:hypothetical protein